MESSTLINKSIDLLPEVRDDGIDGITINIEKTSSTEKHEHARLQKRKNEKKWALQIDVQKEGIKISCIVSMRKGIIHRHLNLYVKVRATVLRVLDSWMNDKNNGITWDWETFKSAKIPFEASRKFDDLTLVLHHGLLKKQVIFIGEKFDAVIVSFFMSVSVLNSPRYNDLHWVVNPVNNDLENDAQFVLFYPVGEENAREFVTHVKTRIMSEHNNERVIVDVLNRDVSGNYPSPLLNELNESLKQGEIEGISSILGKIMRLVKDAGSKGSIDEVKNSLGLTELDASFLFNLHEVMS